MRGTLTLPWESWVNASIALSIFFWGRDKRGFEEEGLHLYRIDLALPTEEDARDMADLI
jgi:hypothetical protein